MHLGSIECTTNLLHYLPLVANRNDTNFNASASEISIKELLKRACKLHQLSTSFYHHANIILTNTLFPQRGIYNHRINDDHIYKIQLCFLCSGKKFTSTVARCFCEQTDPWNLTEGKLSSTRLKEKQFSFKSCMNDILDRLT